VIALANRGDEPTPRAESTPTASPEPTESATEAPTEEPTPEATETATAEPTATATEAPPNGEPDLETAGRLQLEGYNARRAGDYETALARAREAQQACGNSRELSPCGYALFEEGVALIELGQPDAAIPILERRLSEYGDNNNGEVEKALRKARREAGREGGDGRGKQD
jgi:serine/threonine-protein kinase